MCKVGDIILVRGYNHGECKLERHSFIVLNADGGTVQGMEYDMICNVMSSFKSQKQKERRMAFPGNLEVKFGDTYIEDGNSKCGYVKTEQFYYFDKSTIDYDVIGYVSIEFFNKLLEYIQNLDVEIEEITDNLSKSAEETA